MNRDQNSLEVTDRHHNGIAIWWHTGFGWRPDAIHKPMKKSLLAEEACFFTN